ncbi:hypothetical protein GCM10009550_24520 [Actinocorallia libanotica]|uniref:PH domain-containing protein n=1 Tax=Actinocorallia libanotica TaxID=46162 RepID=A0ABN1QW16_9ACTN
MGRTLQDRSRWIATLAAALAAIAAGAAGFTEVPTPMQLGFLAAAALTAGASALPGTSRFKKKLFSDCSGLRHHVL